MTLLPFLALLACPVDGPTSDTYINTSAREDALMLLKADAGQVFEVRFEGGLPVGLVMSSQVEDSVQGVLDFVTLMEPVFRLAEAPERSLYLQRLVQDELGSHYFFGMAVDGQPVIGEELAFHLEGGRLVGYEGSYSLLRAQASAPQLSSLEAGQAALESIEGDYEDLSLAGEPRLVFLQSGETLVQAWQWPLHGQQQGERWLLAWVDSSEGVVLDLLSEGAERAMDVDIIDGDLETSVACWRFLSGAWWSGASGVCDTDGCDSDAPADAKLAWSLNRATYGDLLSVYGRDSYDGSGGQMESVVRISYQDGSTNASYDRGCDQTVYSPGEVCADAVGHEWSHGMDEKTAALVYTTQSGGIDEHLADMNGMFLQWSLEGGYDPLFNEDCVTGVLRDFGNPTAHGSIDHFTQYTGTTDVHRSSGILNRAFDLLIVGGTHRLPSPRIEPVDPDKLRLVMYKTHTTRLRSRASFMDYRAGLLAEARAQSWTMTDICQLKNAFSAVGLGDPDYDCDGVTDVLALGDGDGDGVPDRLDNCDYDPNPSQDDLDGDGKGDLCDTDIDGDGVANGQDSCPLHADPEQRDLNGDGLPDACTDLDGDGVNDLFDSCPLDPDPVQKDRDWDGIPDSCDDDRDGDGIDNDVDVCPDRIDPAQMDFNNDGVGDLCGDADGDGHTDYFDPCPETPDRSPPDLDRDGLWACEDDDDDGDGILDLDDSCPMVYDKSNLDSDEDGIGDVCDACPQDYDPFERDLDADGLPDVCDPNFDYRAPIADADLRCLLWSSDPGGCMDGGGYDLDTLAWATYGPWASELSHAGQVAGAIPLPVCMQDCPDSLSEDWVVQVSTTVPANHHLLILDERSRVVAKAAPGVEESITSQTLRFHPGAGARSVVGGQQVSDRSYWAVVVPDRSSAGQPYLGELRVEAGVLE